MRNLVGSMLRLVPWGMRDRIRRVPGVAALQRAIVARTIDGHSFDHTVDAGPAQGITFHIAMPEDKGIWTGTYEIEFATALAACVTRGAPAYDIGSWHGFFAGVMAAQGASAVHVFEPLPANADRIRRLVTLNPERSITLHACAVGDRDAEMDLMIMPETSMAKLEASSFQAGETSAERVRVKLVSLDSVIAAGAAPPPALMKIDVEGAEIMVLNGAAATIRAHRPAIFAEVHSSDLLRQFRAFLEPIGYAVSHLDTDAEEARRKDVFQVKAIA